MEYDLIVCGGGPAGAMAAATAAQAGQKVLLLEKERLPRYKTCGGGMPMVAGDLVPELAPDAVVEARTRFMRHTWQFDRPYLFPIDPDPAERETTIWMVQRSRFDHALVERAARLGAEVRDGLALRTVEQDRTGVTVRAASGRTDSALTATAGHLIGADGATGMTARCAHLRRKRRLAIAVEVEQPHDWGTGHPDLRPDVLHLEYGCVPHGYAWAFPKGEHLSVGAGILHGAATTAQPQVKVGAMLKEVVFRYLDHLRVPYARERVRFHAHPIPIWSGKERLHTRGGRILLAGDAAGLVNPLFGDGILHALRSGTLAAQCLLDGAAADYTRRVHAAFAPTFSAADRLSGLLYRWAPLLYEHGICRPRATHLAARLLCGEPLTPDLMALLMRRLRAVIGRTAVPRSGALPAEHRLP
jgi:geranylgeranyl reductase family protein